MFWSFKQKRHYVKYFPYVKSLNKEAGQASDSANCRNPSHAACGLPDADNVPALVPPKLLRGRHGRSLRRGNGLEPDLE